SARPVSTPEPSTPRPSPQSSGVDTVSLSSQGKIALENAEKTSPTAPDPQTNIQTTSPLEQSQSNSANLNRKFSTTEDNQVVLKIIDPETQEVIKQIPPEDEVKLKEAIRQVIRDFQTSNQSTETIKEPQI
ncbi:MAG: flagellar protein FlaG, partial [Nitrospinales bacterium]